MTRASAIACALAIAIAGCAMPKPEDKARCVTAAAMSQFTFTDARAWRWCEEAGCAGCLELLGTSAYTPPHRSPIHLAMLAEPDFGDFDLRLEAQQTGREYPHRDLVLVFGYRDAAHFAYAHLASKADQSAHHLQLVDGADRRPVTTQRTDGVIWGSGWHELRVRRTGTRVEVWFDGGDPVLVGEAPEWRGRVGFGSFDDQGRFRNLRIENG